MPTSTSPHPDAPPLLVFNHQVLDQCLRVVSAHDGPERPRYAGPVGSHLRHAIEHWQALVWPAQPGCVDYDARPRDATLEASPALALTRLQDLQQQLATWCTDTLSAPVQVRGQCGLAGEFDFAVPSTLGRELAFVASHAVHHLALIRPHCLAQGIAIEADLGKAPATVAHELANARANAPALSTDTPPTLNQET